MKVKDCMTNSVCNCTPETTIQDVAKKMCSNHIGCLPVCDNTNSIVGLITDRDIVLRSVACGKDSKTTPISEIMTTNVCCCNSNDEVNEAEKLMGTMQIKRIPVLDNNKVVGMITVGNLVNDSKVTSIEVSNTVENICHCGPNAKNNE